MLNRNYRSAPQIVHALNAFSKAAFPTLHHDQIPVRPDESQNGKDPLRIISVPWAGTSAATDQAVGEQVGAILASRAPSDAYGLVPVTLNKFKLETATAAVRQTVHSFQPSERILVLDPSANKDDIGAAKDAYVLATSRRIKGTERPLVVAYGIDRDYDVTVDPAAICKLIFVQLSRARDELVLVTQRLTRQRIKTIIAPFIKSVTTSSTVITAEPVQKPQALQLIPIPVTGENLGSGGGTGLSQVPFVGRAPWDVENSSLPALGDVRTDKCDYDFLGCLAEAHVARAVNKVCSAHVKSGVFPADMTIRTPLASPGDLKIVESRHRSEHGISTTSEGEYILCTSRDNREMLNQVIKDLGPHYSEAGSPYFHAMIAFTARCGTPWTVSQDLGEAALNATIAANADIAAGALVDLLTTLGTESETRALAHWRGIAMHMEPCRRFTRSDLAANGFGGAGADQPLTPTAMVNIAPGQVKKLSNARVHGEVDILIHGIPVELKHTRELTPEHERQLFCYMMMCASPIGVLYSSRTGETRILRVRDYETAFAQFMCNARSVLAMRSARTMNLQHLNKHAICPPSEIRTTSGAATSLSAAAPATTAIVLDVESDDKGLTTEIGAVAVSLTDWEVLGTFQARVPSAMPIVQGMKQRSSGAQYHVEKVTGLRRGGTPTFHETESAELERRFKSWCGEISTVSPIYLHWAGSEKKLIGNARTLDVHKSCYVPWLDHKNGLQAKGTQRSNLSTAMEQLLPQLPFFAHQAFEDALATLAILLVTIQLTGAL